MKTDLETRDQKPEAAVAAKNKAMPDRMAEGNPEAREKLPELLPCPFCGQAATCEPLDDPDDPDEAQFVVMCVAYNFCLANPMAFGDTPAQAIAAWNRREKSSAELPTPNIEAGNGGEA